MDPGMQAPVLGFSPHYAKSSNLEAQAKVFKCYNNVDIGAKFDKKRLNKESTTVTLNEGDIMYHPAGIWHSVESVTDSISINFSMRQVRGADFIVNALRMQLLKDIDMRRGIRFAPDDHNNKAFIKGLKESFKKASKVLNKLNPQQLLPPAIHIPRALEIDLDEVEVELYRRPKKLTMLKVGQTLTVSQYFILIDLKVLPQ